MLTPEIICLATVIQGEAGAESIRGKEAVAQVVINRVNSPKFPDTLCAVTNQPNQFNGKKKPTQASIKIAIRALLGKMTNWVGKRLYFNTKGPRNALRIGNHRFW